MPNPFFIFGINLPFGAIPIASDPCYHLWARVVDPVCSGLGRCSGCHGSTVPLFHVPFMLDSICKYRQFILVRVDERNQKCNEWNQR